MRRELNLKGWYFVPSSQPGDLGEILASLGSVVSRERDGKAYRDLFVYSREEAPLHSMSSIAGKGLQPRHTDAAFCPQPPRYIALQCLEPGEAPCPTHVWPLNVEVLMCDQPDILTGSYWVARGGSNSPFYCSVMEIQHGQVRIRFEPFCMRPRSGVLCAIAEAEQALQRFTDQIDFFWELGDLLIIDNWRCLHARGNGADKSPSRHLRRWSIGG